MSSTVQVVARVRFCMWSKWHKCAGCSDWFYTTTTMISLFLTSNFNFELASNKDVFFFFCISSYISGVHNFGWDFWVCDLFCDPTIEVISFCLRGWSALGVFWLLTFNRLEHVYQDLLSWCHGMHLYMDWTLVYTLIWKSCREWSQNPCQHPLYWKAPKRANPSCCIMWDSKPNGPPTELFQPLQ